MLVERREGVTRIEIKGQRTTGGAQGSGGRRQPSLGGTSRMNREIHVRICERLGVQFPGATRQVNTINQRSVGVQHMIGRGSDPRAASHIIGRTDDAMIKNCLDESASQFA
jgi:hypothetical protein